jgi:hypothetical protein
MGVFLNNEAREELNEQFSSILIPENLDLDGVIEFIIGSGRYSYCKTFEEKKSRIIWEISALPLSEDFIRDNKDVLAWFEVSSFANMSESFMDEFSEYLDGCWNTVLCNQTYSDEFFVKNYGKISFDEVAYDVRGRLTFWCWIITEGRVSTDLISYYDGLGEIPSEVWERVYE